MTTVALNGKKKKSLKSRLIDQKYLFLLMIPGVIWVLVICYAPMSGLYMAFTNYRPTQAGYFADLFGAKFVGFQWFCCVCGLLYVFAKILLFSVVGKYISAGCRKRSS